MAQKDYFSQFEQVVDEPDYFNQFESDFTGPVSVREPGNIDLYGQPKVANPKGGYSTVASVGMNLNDRETLLSSVTPDGRFLSDPQAIYDEYRKTGKHLGKFNSWQESNAYAEQLHRDYEAGKYEMKPVSQMKGDSIYGQPTPTVKKEPDTYMGGWLKGMGDYATEMGQGLFESAAHPKTAGDILGLLLPNTVAGATGRIRRAFGGGGGETGKLAEIAEIIKNPKTPPEITHELINQYFKEAETPPVPPRKTEYQPPPTSHNIRTSSGETHITGAPQELIDELYGPVVKKPKVRMESDGSFTDVETGENHQRPGWSSETGSVPIGPRNAVDDVLPSGTQDRLREKGLPTSGMSIEEANKLLGGVLDNVDDVSELRRSELMNKFGGLQRTPSSNNWFDESSGWKGEPADTPINHPQQEMGLSTDTIGSEAENLAIAELNKLKASYGPDSEEFQSAVSELENIYRGSNARNVTPGFGDNIPEQGLQTTPQLRRIGDGIITPEVLTPDQYARFGDVDSPTFGNLKQAGPRIAGPEDRALTRELWGRMTPEQTQRWIDLDSAMKGSLESITPAMHDEFVALNEMRPGPKQPDQYLLKQQAEATRLQNVAAQRGLPPVEQPGIGTMTADAGRSHVSAPGALERMNAMTDEEFLAATRKPQSGLTKFLKDESGEFNPDAFKRKGKQRPDGVTIRKDEDFGYSGTWHVKLPTGEEVKIFRDPENKWWHIDSKAENDLNPSVGRPRTTAFSKEEMIEKLLKGDTNTPLTPGARTFGDRLKDETGSVPIGQPSKITIKDPTPAKVKKALEMGYEMDEVGADGKWRMKYTGKKQSPILEEEVGHGRHRAPTDKVKEPSLIKDAMNIPRTIMASMDLSAPLRQGLGLIHKKEFWTSLDDMVRSWGSEVAYDAVQNSIRERPLFKPRVGVGGKILPSFAEEMGIHLTDLKSMTTREESIVSSLAEKVPGVRRSNRAYTAFLNKLRADTFESLIKDGKIFGADGTKNIVLAKELANFVNNASGRGSLNFGRLGSLEKSATTLNSIFFSPRLIASRLQYFNPATYIMASPMVRKEAIQSLLAITTVGTTLGQLAKMSGLGTVESDATSSDFGKIKIGNTRIDPFGGFQQYVVAAAKLVQGQAKSTVTGNKYSLTDRKFGHDSRFEVAERFGINKLNPIATFAVGMLKGRDIRGRPFNVPEEVVNRFVPIMMADIKDLLFENPNLIPGIHDKPSYDLGNMHPENLPFAIPSAFGMGVQRYEDKF